MANEVKTIPYWVYLIVGIVVIAFSWIVNNQTGDNKLNFFIVVGIIFLLVGFVKWVYAQSHFKKKKVVAKVLHTDKPYYHSVNHSAHQQGQHRTAVHGQTQHAQHNSAHTSQHTVHHATAQAQHTQTHVTHKTPDVRCHHCRAKLHPSFRHCPGCGMRVK